MDHASRLSLPREQMMLLTTQLILSISLQRHEVTPFLRVVSSLIEIGQYFPETQFFKKLEKIKESIELDDALQRFLVLYERYISRLHYQKSNHRKSLPKNLVSPLCEKGIELISYLVNEVCRARHKPLFQTLLESPCLLALCYVNINWKEFFANVQPHQRIPLLALYDEIPSLDFDSLPNAA